MVSFSFNQVTKCRLSLLSLRRKWLMFLFSFDCDRFSINLCNWSRSIMRTIVCFTFKADNRSTCIWRLLLFGICLHWLQILEPSVRSSSLCREVCNCKKYLNGSRCLIYQSSECNISRHLSMDIATTKSLLFSLNLVVTFSITNVEMSSHYSK